MEKKRDRKKKSILDDFKQACHNSVRGTRAVCLPPRWYAWPHTGMENTDTQACTHARQYVWVSVTEGSVCTPKAVTPRKPSQNTLIKMSPTITAHPDPLTFTPPMNTVSYSVSISHSREAVTHTLWHCGCQVRVLKVQFGEQEVTGCFW